MVLCYLRLVKKLVVSLGLQYLVPVTEGKYIREQLSS